MRKVIVHLFYLFAFLFSLGGLWLTNGGYVFVAKYFYPLEFHAQVLASSREFNLDPLFVATVIREESRFRPLIRSSKGAVGLMQLLPSTAAWGAQIIPIRGFKVEQLEDPAVNIRIGCWYLSYLWKQFGSGEMVLAAYNGGEGNASKWHNPERLSFPETQEYLRRGKATYEMYRKLYGSNAPPILWIKPIPLATESL